MNIFSKLVTTMGLKGIISMIFFLVSNSAMAINPKVGAWWSPAESGRGYVLDGTGQTLAMQAYTYDSSGQPMWYLAVGQLKNNGANWSGTLEKYVGGQCFGCTYQQNQVNGNDGVISIQFTSDTTGIMTMPNGMKSNIQSYFPVGASPVGAIAPSGLAALFGTVNLSYKFNSSSTIYSDSFKFSSANLNSDGTNITNMLLGSTTKAASCTLAPSSTSYGYSCVIVSGSSASAADMFLFNMNSSKAISGLYYYCLSISNLSTCVSGMLTSPHGVVSGNVLALSSGLEIFSNGNLIPDNNELKKAALQEQNNSTIAPNSKTPIDMNVVVDVVESFEKLLN